MLTVNRNVEVFSQHGLAAQRDLLATHGETSNDLLTNLFTTAYETLQDQPFHQDIAGLENKYNDGRLNFDADALMEYAINTNSARCTDCGPYSISQETLS